MHAMALKSLDIDQSPNRDKCAMHLVLLAKDLLATNCMFKLQVAAFTNMD